MEEEPKKDETAGPQPDQKEEAFMKQLRGRLDASIENEKEEREKGMSDTRFINGKQWEDEVEKQRGNKRLSLTINKLPAVLDQIDGDIRLNTPSLKVKGVDNVSDPDTADVIEGLVRYIQRNSKSTKVHSYAGLHAAASGRGAWRIDTDYVSNDSFEQEIQVNRIIDAFTVYYDPGAEKDDKQDGKYFLIASLMPKETFRDEFGVEPVDFEIEDASFSNWQKDDNVVVAEYFWKDVVKEETLYLLTDGSVTNQKPEDDSLIDRDRLIKFYKIKWAKVDGKRILEKGEIPGTMFPIVLTWGKQLCVDGKIETRGIARHSKDAQRLYNYFRSTDAESAALQPKQPYLLPDVCMTTEFMKIWERANDENMPYLPYHVSTKHPDKRPHRESPAMASSANREQIQMADQEIRDTTGMQKAALGRESNETSGVAITKRKQESDTGQFAYTDNLGDAVQTEGKIILSMIPEIFDIATQLRILGKDMKEKVVEVNEVGGIDLTTGRYDVDVSVDGSYSTQREEFQEKLGLILPLLTPEQQSIIGDLIFEMQDFHRADDIAARLKKLIPPEFIDDEPGEDGEEPMGEEIPRDENGEPIEAEPTPEEAAQAQAAEAQIAQEQVQLEIDQVTLEQEKAKLEGLKLDNLNKKQVAKDTIKGLISEMVKGEVS